MSHQNGRKDITIKAPPAVASARGGVPSSQEIAAAQGLQVDPRELVLAQQAEIRELRREVGIQQECAGKFANLVACLAAKLLEQQGIANPADIEVVVERRLLDRFDGVQVALNHTADADVAVTITERIG